MNTLTAAQTNAALKAISRSILSLRDRIERTPEGWARDQMQAELDHLAEAREALEASG